MAKAAYPTIGIAALVMFGIVYFIGCLLFNVFYTIFRFKAGFYSDDTWLWWVIGFGGVIIGSSLGTRCFDVISNRMLKRIVYVMMIASGISQAFF